SGMNCTTGSLRRTLPCSIKIMMLVVVATTLVRLARSKVVSSVIASRCGSTARAPYALRQTTLPCRATSTTAPGSSFFSIEAAMTASMRARRSAENPWVAGSAVGSCAKTDCAKISATAIRDQSWRRILAVGFQLNSSAARIHSGKRNRQTTLDIVLAQQRLRGSFLQTRHIAVRDEIGLQVRKTHQDVRIAKADSDEVRVLLD